MNNSKVFLLINSLNPREKKQIAELLKTDIFDLNNAEKELLRYFLSVRPEKIAGLDKKSLFTIAFFKGTYDDQKLRLAISRIYKSLEKYVIIQQLGEKENDKYKSLILSRYFRKKELNKLYLSNYKSSLRHPEYERWMPFDLQLEDAFENYQFTSLQKRSQELNIQSLLDLTDRNFFSQKLRFVCYALSHGAIYSKDYDFELLEEIMKTIEDHELYSNPRIGVYYYCYLMLTKYEDENSYFKYKDFLFEHQKYFAEEEIRSLYFFALNHCIKKLNSGNLEYGKEGLEIYRNGISNKTLFINNHLSRFTYRNMAMMAIRINEFDLAETLTDEYEEFLRREDREAAYHFNKALIFYHKKELEEALDNIMKADFKDHLINLAAKTLQAKIYYELKEHFLLESHLDSLEIYLIRNKVLGYHKRNYKNFIKYSKRLVKLNPYNKDRRDKLKEKISTEEVLTEKRWLLEQVQ